MKILLVGNGARENAIFNKLIQSSHQPEVVVFGKAKNPAMLKASAYEVGNINSVEEIIKIAERHKPELAVIGPDDPIANGAADALQKLGISTFAPLKKLARLESSKSFTRNLLEKHGIPGNPIYKVFTKENSAEEMQDFIEHTLNSEYVVKFDGLLGGKGVKVSGEHLQTVEEGIRFAKECLQDAEQVVIEEKLIGPEFSFFCFADGKSLAPMPIIHDHKRAFDNDLGPNTGGMGSFSDSNHLLPFIDNQDQKQAFEITQKVQRALKQETGLDYCGVLYGGFMKTKNGVKLIEFNARFGDPEAMNLLSLLETDLLEVILACTSQSLQNINIKFAEKASVCLYIVPSNYPGGMPLSEDQKIITINKKVLEVPGLHTHFASVDLLEETDKFLKLQLSSSRALSFTAICDTIERSKDLALKGIQFVEGSISYRTDIGSETLIQKRVNLTQSI